MSWLLQMSAQPRRAPLLLHSALVSESTMSSSNAMPFQHGALEAELLHAPPELSAQLEGPSRASPGAVHARQLTRSVLGGQTLAMSTARWGSA